MSTTTQADHSTTELKSAQPHPATPSPMPGSAIPLPIKRLDDQAIQPEYKSELAAGMDLCACLPRNDTPDPIVLEPGMRAIVPTGWAIAIPAGYEGQVRARSGLAAKHGIALPNGVGTIDADYRGELMVALVNIGTQAFEITHGMRIAQLVIAPVMHAAPQVVDELDETARAAGGFGSTGTQ